MSTRTVVTVIPDCQLCVKQPAPFDSPAYADAKLSSGQWGYVCESHFVLEGCSLGLGAGQRLIRRTAE